MSFLPSITFGIYRSQIFPWAILKSITNIKKVWFEYCILFVILLPAIVIGINNTGITFETIRSTASIVNALILFFYIIKSNGRVIGQFLKILKTVIIIQICVGIFQLFIPIEGLFNLLGTGTLGGSGHGASGLSNEPGRQALSVMLMYSTYMTINPLNYSNRKKILFDLFFFLYLLFVNKSATGAGLFIIYFMLKNISFRKILLLVSLPILVLNIHRFLPNQLVSNNRPLRLIKEISTYTTSESGWILVAASGFRFSSVVAVYSRPTLLGYGFGNWRNGIIKNLTDNKKLYDILPENTRNRVLGGVRPMSFSSGLILESGLVGFSMVLLMILFSLPASCFYKTRGTFVQDNKIIILLLLIILFMGQIGNPIPFICLGLLFKTKYYGKRFGLGRFVINR